ncbi:MAG: cysteine desulfurase [Cytophagales bacterium]|nr:cysteine desulfurase [Bernardetiaceae bacterium]MDW8204091.1 cysteine desulfurase [Cytophagales bacterium]
MLNPELIRRDFPILQQKVNGKPLIYFDNAATSQKPRQVIDALAHYYTSMNANVHRGVHFLAEKATEAFEETRQAVAQMINAPAKEQIIFTRGTTESINLVAASYGRNFIGEGDEIIISTMEHHSNIVPWQMLCLEKKAVLKVLPINDAGELLMEEYRQMLSTRTKLVAVMHVSNALGTVNPVSEIIRLAHEQGAKVLIDGAQAVPHYLVDVQALDVDFYAFSAHKMYGPTGMGILYGKRDLLEAMPPYMGGGEMIKEVRFNGTTYNDIPYKFEAGTPNIADVVAMKAAIDYMQGIGQQAIAQHEQNLLQYAVDSISSVPGIRLVGTAKQKASVLSFLIEGVHPMDVGMLLDAKGIAVRTGNHCAMPLMERLGIPGTVRASFAVYNTEAEIDTFAKELRRAADILL